MNPRPNHSAAPILPLSVPTLPLRFLLAGLLLALPSACTHTGLTSHDSPLPTPLRCLSDPPALAETLPPRLPVGIETIHRDSEKIITI